MSCSWSSNVTSYHIISHIGTRWCWCCSRRYSVSDIIDLSARDTSRHHITSHHITSNAIVTLNCSQSHSQLHYSAIPCCTVILLSHWRRFVTGRPNSNIGRTVIENLSSLLLLLLLLCVVTIAERCSRSVWLSCVLSEVRSLHSSWRQCRRLCPEADSLSRNFHLDWRHEKLCDPPVSVLADSDR